MEYNFADVIREKKRIHSEYIKGHCVGCPLSLTENGHDMLCDEFMREYPDEYAKVVMDWAETHKPKTNGEVAREMLEEKFGIKMSTALQDVRILSVLMQRIAKTVLIVAFGMGNI